LSEYKKYSSTLQGNLNRNQTNTHKKITSST